MRLLGKHVLEKKSQIRCGISTGCTHIRASHLAEDQVVEEADLPAWEYRPNRSSCWTLLALEEVHPEA